MAHAHDTPPAPAATAPTAPATPTPAPSQDAEREAERRARDAEREADRRVRDAERQARERERQATARTRSSGIVATRTPSWLDSQIDIDINNASITDAVKKVLDAAKTGSDRVVVEFATPKDQKVTLKAKGVAARDALAAIARLAGANAYVGQEDGKAGVWLRRRAETVNGPVFFTGNGAGMSVDVQRQVQDALRQAQRATTQATRTPFVYNLIGSRSLPDRRVSLDARGTDVREALKTVLKQAKLDYALEDDVPEDAKKSFTFENVPIATALDVICQSAGVGWRVERTRNVVVVTTGTEGAAASGGGKDKNGKDAEDKIVVRIGKKYATHAQGGLSQSWYTSDLTPSLIEDFVVPTFPAPVIPDVLIPAPVIAPLL
jgi:hypothetical protein